jgi:hypothetical protein
VPREIDEFTGDTAIEVKAAGVMVKSVDPVMDPEVAVIELWPVAMVLASPLVLTAATPTAELLQVTELVRSRVLPSVYVPVAVNCWVVPMAIDGFAGVTATDTKAALVTFRVVDPLTFPEAAAMVVVPVPVPEASPALETVATAGAEECQVTVAVMFCVLPSV